MNYPKRFSVPKDKKDWSITFPEYDPLYYVSQIVLQRPEWADDENILNIERDFESYEGPVLLDSKKRPLNPKGRTGLQGRGVLGKWGRNEAADAIITRQSGSGVEVVLIKRKDTGLLAIPGGMVDAHENPLQAAQRELFEETSLDLDLSLAKQIYQGYVDDPRNTDHVWIETTVFWLHIKENDRILEVKAQDDALEAFFISFNKVNFDQIYANHSEFLEIVKREVY